MAGKVGVFIYNFYISSTFVRRVRPCAQKTVSAARGAGSDSVSEERGLRVGVEGIELPRTNSVEIPSSSNY